ncbi:MULTISPECIES: flavodoxin FldA [unclassified Picosynechococcus]|uniref:flavodoxin FldA n=1 Tax=unclassified Picosynechococcus TaxID=3079910 RepID=UPI00074580D1|nr:MULTISPECIES: flavodoxin FldA [unclassified Picosynechococcus]AMA09018.1 flavodoxin FldA [Picosynechococcus sp. PCC 73109]ANV87161.1 flavodoxin [Picosynechococcus sp. PCC 7117]
MSKIGLFFGTQTGNTEELAQAIQAAFGGSDIVELFDVAEVDIEALRDFDQLIIGCPTWNVGELQSDWEALYDDLDDVDFSGKTIAYFGAGDQVGYADNFQDAMGILEEKITSLGGKTVGQWPTAGYDHSESKAERDGKFIGLAIDEDNQPELTAERIQAWVAQLKPAFGL